MPSRNYGTWNDQESRWQQGGEPYQGRESERGRFGERREWEGRGGQFQDYSGSRWGEDEGRRSYGESGRRSEEGREFERYPEGRWGMGQGASFGPGYGGYSRQEGRSGSWNPEDYGRRDWRSDEGRYGGYGEGRYGREDFGRRDWRGEEGRYGEARYGREDYGRRDWDDRGRFESFGERMREGWRRLTGRGPKGYVRSDERIREDVSEAIARSWINAENVEVQVKDGEVTLSGTVEERRDKRQLEDIAENCFGVKDVRNDLRVQPQATGTTSGTNPRGEAGTSTQGSKTIRS